MGILIEQNFFSVRAALPYDPFRSKEITDISITNEYFVCTDFKAALGFANSIKFVFLYLSRCSAFITMTLLLLLLLVS